MAFQMQELKIKGTFDGLSFYNSEFGWLVRTKGGPSRKQFKTSKAFARARENSSEFSNCSRAASLIRKLIFKHTAQKDPALYHRLIKLMRQLANYDSASIRGMRCPLKGLHNPQALSLLKDFHITNHLTLYTLLLHAKLFKPKLKRKNKPHIFRPLTNHNFPNCRRPHKYSAPLGPETSWNYSTTNIRPLRGQEKDRGKPRNNFPIRRARDAQGLALFCAGEAETKKAEAIAEPGAARCPLLHISRGKGQAPK